MELKFWKYEGTGNDLIMIDGREDERELRADTIRRLCDRHKGIGGDGLLILLAHAEHDFRMRYFNADGGEVDMCGNGGRCMALFADDLGVGGDNKRFVSRDGEHSATIVSRGENETIVEISMRDVDSYEYSDRAFVINTGVPHYVEFVDDVDSVDVFTRGSEIRYAERFEATGGTNVDFVEIVGEGLIKIRTYERGVEDETYSCGTGVTASAIATRLFAQAEQKEFTIITRGGELNVSFETPDNLHFHDIKLTGPARKIFSGEVKL